MNSQRRLNFQIRKDGINLSKSEKQLISFARAALKKSKVIIFDESLNSMDKQTESIIDDNIEKLFQNCTILYIGNILDMINRCERIIFLENGEIVEDDTYENLLANQNSKFYGLYIDIITPKK